MVSHSMALPLPLTASSPSLMLAVPWAAEHGCPGSFQGWFQANSMARSFKGCIRSLPLRKRELFLRLLRHKTNIVSHFDSGERQKVGAWKVKCVPSKKENFLVQKELSLVERLLGVGKLGLDVSHSLGLQRSRVPSIFHFARVTLGRQSPNWWWTLKLPRSPSGWQRRPRVFPASGTPL